MQDEKLHFRVNSRLKRGWSVGAQLLLERFSYDPDLYANYVTLTPRGAGTDTTAYHRHAEPGERGLGGLGQHAEFKRFSLTSFVLYGVDENFPEWSSARIAIANLGLNVRPTDQLRIAGTWNVETYNRRTDGTRVLTRNVPRVRVEYQVSRQVFVRVIGEVAKLKQDSLRDDSRTNRPVYFRNKRWHAHARRRVRPPPRAPGLPLLVPADARHRDLFRLRKHLACRPPWRHTGPAAEPRRVLHEVQLSLPPAMTGGSCTGVPPCAPS